MKYARTEQLHEMLVAGGEEALAALPEFEIPDEQYDRNFAEVCAQGLHDSEDERHARALYRCLTSRVTAPRGGESAANLGGFHLERAVRGLNQTVAVLAGKTEAHEQLLKAAVDKVSSVVAARSQEIIGTADSQYQELKREFAGVKADTDALHTSIQATQHLIERRYKQLAVAVVVIWISICLLFLFLYVPMAHGQDKPAAPAKPSISLSAPSSDKVVVLDAIHDSTVVSLTSLNVPDSYKLRIRDVQYAKDKVLIRLQNLELQAQKAQQEADAKDKTINEIVYQLATENHVDLSKWVLDLDLLSWQPKGK